MCLDIITAKSRSRKEIEGWQIFGEVANWQRRKYHISLRPFYASLLSRPAALPKIGRWQRAIHSHPYSSKSRPIVTGRFSSQFGGSYPPGFHVFKDKEEAEKVMLERLERGCGNLLVRKVIVRGVHTEGRQYNCNIMVAHWRRIIPLRSSKR